MKNNYKTYFLKFATEEESITKLTEVNYYRTVEETNPETEEVETRSYYTVGDIPGGIDIVGEIWNDDGVYETDEETGEISVISEPTKKDGWHLNIILASPLPEALNAYLVTPQNPHRKFAGMD
jgi:hypothetical protein